MSFSKLYSKTCRRVAFGVASVAIVAATPSQALELTFPDDDAISRALMPYAPLVFDIVVQTSRSFAEITYDQRGYDPVTRTFVVKGLHVKRDAVDVAIGLTRMDLSSVMLEDLAVDTRGIDLPPPLRDGLRKIGRDTIEGDILVGVRANAARSAYELSMQYDLADIGVVAANATIDGFHVLVPLSDLENAALTQQPIVKGSLVKASIAYEDRGLMKAAFETTAEQSGVGADLLKAGIVATPTQIAAQMIGGLPGGASDDLQAQVLEWAKTVEGFLSDEDAIRITLNPAEPLALDRFAAGVVDEALITAMNPTVTRGFAQAAAPAPSAGGLAQASALLSGEGGIPQDREAGARALMTLAASGDLDAVRTLAGSFGDALLPELDAAGQAELYRYLLVARAVDGIVSDKTLSALTTVLAPEAVLASEREAATYFATHGDTDLNPVSAETMGDYNAETLRAAAFDFYDGDDVPRDFTRALSLALVASAAGDTFAAGLRDNLTTAAQRKEIVVALADARTEAAKLWTAYQATHKGTAPTTTP